MLMFLLFLLPSLPVLVRVQSCQPLCIGQFCQFQDMTDMLPCHIRLPCESWTFTAELHRRICAMEMRCYCKMFCISYKDYVTNEEVCAKIQQAFEPRKDLLTFIKRCKSQWYGHVSHSSDPAKPSWKGTLNGVRRRDRQKKRWEDNIREWAGLEFAKSQEGS